MSRDSDPVQQPPAGDNRRNGLRARRAPQHNDGRGCLVGPLRGGAGSVQGGDERLPLFFVKALGKELLKLVDHYQQPWGGPLTRALRAGARDGVNKRQGQALAPGADARPAPRIGGSTPARRSEDLPTPDTPDPISRAGLFRRRDIRSCTPIAPRASTTDRPSASSAPPALPEPNQPLPGIPGHRRSCPPDLRRSFPAASTVRAGIEHVVLPGVVTDLHTLRASCVNRVFAGTHARVVKQSY